MPSVRGGFVRACLGFLAVNLLFVLLQYIADFTPPDKVREVVQEAFHKQALSPMDSPHLKFGIDSSYALIGIDGWSDCFTIRSTLLRDSNPWRTAVVPRIATPVAPYDKQRLCGQVKSLVEDHVPIDAARSDVKARLWHGARATFLLALPYVNLFQLNELIKQSTYFLYFLFGLSCAWYGARFAALAMPIALLGIYFSSVPYFGFVMSLPYLWALAVPVLLLNIGRRTESRSVVRQSMMVFGSIHAFFYILDGSMMLVLPLSIFAMYFFCFGRLDVKQRWRETALTIVIYVASFCGSFVFKQLISAWFIGFQAVFGAFFGAVELRLSHEVGGSLVSPLMALENVMGYLRYSVFYIHGLDRLLMVTGMAAWSVAMALFIKRLFDPDDWERKSAFLVCLACAAIVVLRYVMMTNHTDIHAFIVGRFQFVLLAFGWVGLLVQVRYPHRRVGI